VDGDGSDGGVFSVLTGLLRVAQGALPSDTLATPPPEPGSDRPPTGPAAFRSTTTTL
jgi:hypothetical protein